MAFQFRPVYLSGFWTPLCKYIILFLIKPSAISSYNMNPLFFWRNRTFIFMSPNIDWLLSCNRLPNEPIVSKSIITEIKDGSLGWYTIDLEPYNIYIDKTTKDIAVTI